MIEKVFSLNFIWMFPGTLVADSSKRTSLSNAVDSFTGSIDEIHDANILNFIG